MKNKKNFKGIQINIRCSDWEKDIIKKNAKRKKKSLSRYLIEKGLKGD